MYDGGLHALVLGEGVYVLYMQMTSQTHTCMHAHTHTAGMKPICSQATKKVDADSEATVA